MNRPSPLSACVSSLSVRQARRQGGALLIEVLVSILICAFGLLGFVGIQARAAQMSFESHQRSQALLLVEDMVNRINANRMNASSYLTTTGLVGSGSTASCASATTVAARDLCEWTNPIRGSSEVRGSSNVGAMLKARGCITRATGTTDRYVVAVFWEGMIPTGAPAGTCTGLSGTYGTPALIREASATLCIAQLTGDAAEGRC